MAEDLRDSREVPPVLEYETPPAAPSRRRPGAGLALMGLGLIPCSGGVAYPWISKPHEPWFVGPVLLAIGGVFFLLGWLVRRGNRVALVLGALLAWYIGGVCGLGEYWNLQNAWADPECLRDVRWLGVNLLVLGLGGVSLWLGGSLMRTACRRLPPVERRGGEVGAGGGNSHE